MSQLVNRKRQLELDQKLAAVAKVAKRLPAVLGRSAVNRDELTRLLENKSDRLAEQVACEQCAPQQDQAKLKLDEAKPKLDEAKLALDEGRQLAEASALAPLYLPRFDELELELEILGALGTEKARTFAARRFPTGKETLPNGQTLQQLAAHIAGTLPSAPSPAGKTIPATGASGSLEAALRSVAVAARIPAEVRVVPNLVAKAAAGEKTVFISDRPTTEHEALRLAAHEVLAHLVAATNGRSQRLMILRVGTAESFADQEGLALMLEAKSGTMSTSRLRAIAGRTLAAHATYEGASFVALVRYLEAQGFSLDESVVLAERAQRGGGVAKDAAYLLGLVRVREALKQGESIDVLRAGRLSVSSLPLLRALAVEDTSLFRPPNYRPSLSRSLAATGFGTSPATSPPSRAASLTILDET